MKSDLDVRDEVTAGFGRWQDMSERALTAMRGAGSCAATPTPGGSPTR